MTFIKTNLQQDGKILVTACAFLDSKYGCRIKPTPEWYAAPYRCTLQEDIGEDDQTCPLLAGDAHVSLTARARHGLEG